MSLLEVTSLDAGYGDFQALFDIHLTVETGELLALVGANGAGKSTLLRTIAGAIAPMSGHVRYAGADITGQPDFMRARTGIVLVPEGRRLFPTLTVEENLLVGGSTRRDGPWNLSAVFDLLPIVADLRNRACSHLSGGEQQAVAIGRALMSNPDLLLLDEVSLGLAPIIVGQLYAVLPNIRERGMTVILVEQDLSRTLAVADRVACMLEGRLVLAGRPAELTREQVTDAYFGHGYGYLDTDSGAAR
ncbi:MAG: ABC transporter ATP-binding protein [Actinobacteria bacterium]|nr:ABC transporter ATP-binding protein [Actinomycetota bacterium]MBI3686709.1 ABC transporter ATP-binding protein [Actinomycetota bacterium]